MNTFKIQETALTPKIDFNGSNGQMSISGKSILFEKNLFWEDIISWYKTYVLNPKDKTVLHIDLEYFNSISAKFLYYFLKLNKYIIQKGLILQIYWSIFSDDQDMLDIVEIMKKEIGLPIEILIIQKRKSKE